MRPLALAVLALAACTDDVTVVRVTVQARRTMAFASTMTVDATDGQGLHTTATLGGQLLVFPTSFTFTPAEGKLAFDLVALDRDNRAVGRASASANAVASTVVDVDVLLAPDDFLLTRDYTHAYNILGSKGITSARQLAVGPNGGMLAVWTSGTLACATNPVCAIRAQLLDRNLVATAPAPNGEIAISTLPASAGAIAVAGGANGYLVAWEANDTGKYRVWAVTVDAAGAVGTPFVAAEESVNEARFPSLITLSDGTWLVLYTHGSGAGVAARRVGSDGLPRMLGGALQLDIDTGAGTWQPRGILLADGSVAIAYVQDVSTGTPHSSVYVRVYDTSWSPGLFTAPVTGGYQQVTNPGLAEVHDLTLALVWQQTINVGLEVYFTRLGRDGSVHTRPERIDTGIVAPGAAGVAVRPSDGAVGVVWAGAAGGTTNDILIRVLLPNGLPITAPQSVNSTTNGQQQNPSLVGTEDVFVAAWEDGSDAAPAGVPAIRARGVYPRTDLTNGELGAFCRGPPDAPCPLGFICAADQPQDLPRCHVACALAAGTPCPTGGVCDQGACVYAP